MSKIITTAEELSTALSINNIVTDTSLSLSSLPEPSLVFPRDYATNLSDRLTHYADLVEAAGYPRPDLLNLESTPERMLLEESAYLDTLITTRINEAFRANLAYYATESTLDHVAELSGVTRLEGEPDVDLRERIRIANRGQSAAGPDDWWRAHALSADEGVEDVAVTRSDFPYPAPTQRRGDVTLWVLADTLSGEPSVEQLDAVREIVTSDSVRGVTTRVFVEPATQRNVDIVANITLGDDAPIGLFETLPERLARTWLENRRLGWGVSTSWVHAALMAPGVERVDLIGWYDIAAAAHEVPKLNVISLSDVTA